MISSANGLLRERIFLKGHLDHPPDNPNGARTGCGAVAGHGASATELWSSPTLGLFLNLGTPPLLIHGDWQSIYLDTL